VEEAPPAAGEALAVFVCSTDRKEARMADREVLIQRLTEVNPEFRQLRGEHQTYEHELADLQARPFLTAEQQWRVSELKKLKLMAKDRMEALIRQSQASAQTPA
jgi:uncharacterized protein YdcH (DUF465 family)